jgi:hypothetical protein
LSYNGWAFYLAFIMHRQERAMTNPEILAHRLIIQALLNRLRMRFGNIAVPFQNRDIEDVRVAALRWVDDQTKATPAKQ